MLMWLPIRSRDYIKFYKNRFFLRSCMDISFLVRLEPLPKYRDERYKIQTDKVLAAIESLGFERREESGRYNLFRISEHDGYEINQWLHTAIFF